MSSSIGPFGRQELLRSFFDPLWIRPEKLWIALTVTVPVSGAGGEELDEPAASAGYARQPIPIDLDNWAFSGYGDVYNLTQVLWAPVTDDWGLISGWAVLDDEVTGQGYGVGSLVLPQNFEIGAAPYLDPGTIVWSLGD